MNAIRSILFHSIPGMAVALCMPVMVLAAAPSGRVAIMNAHSNLCLSPAGGGRDKNGEIVQFTCDQDPARFWSFTVVEGDVVEITNLNSGLCLTIAGGNTVHQRSRTRKARVVVGMTGWSANSQRGKHGQY